MFCIYNNNYENVWPSLAKETSAMFFIFLVYTFKPCKVIIVNIGYHLTLSSLFGTVIAVFCYTKEKYLKSETLSRFITTLPQYFNYC